MNELFALVHLVSLCAEEKSAAVFAIRRANYTHRRKGVFNAESIEDLKVSGNVRSRTNSAMARLFHVSKETSKNVKTAII